MTECQVSCWSEHTVQFVMYSVVICIYNIHSRYSPFLPISNLVQVNSLALNVISSYYIKQFSSSSPPFPPPSPPSPPSPSVPFTLVSLYTSTILTCFNQVVCEINKASVAAGVAFTYFVLKN